MLVLPYSFNLSVSNSYVYKMKPGDALILHKESDNIYSVIEGILVIQKCFSNEEIFTTSIIGSNGIIAPNFTPSSINNYFYLIEALSISYIIRVNSIDSSLENIRYGMRHFCSIHHGSFYNMEEILIHKTVKNRLIHVLLKLSEMCGVKCGNKIYLEVQLSYKTLSSITGTGKNTIRKLIQSLIQRKIIEYQKKHIVINDLILLRQFHCS